MTGSCNGDVVIRVSWHCLWHRGVPAGAALSPPVTGLSSFFASLPPNRIIPVRFKSETRTGINREYMPRRPMGGMRHMTTLMLGQLRDVLDSFANRDVAKAVDVWTSERRFPRWCVAWHRSLHRRRPPAARVPGRDCSVRRLPPRSDVRPRRPFPRCCERAPATRSRMPSPCVQEQPLDGVRSLRQGMPQIHVRPLSYEDSMTP
jgi:hypothetical protein